MKKFVLLLMVCFFILSSLACSSADENKLLGSNTEQNNVLPTNRAQEEDEVTAVITSNKISFVHEYKPDDVEKILYFDDSQPPETPAETYTNEKEISRIFTMLEGITLDRELDEAELPEIAPGDFCGYTIILKDGNTLTVRRLGQSLAVSGKHYTYSGSFGKQLHINEVIISAMGSIGYPQDGKIELFIDAFDDKNPTLADNPVLKEFDGSRWNAIESMKPGIGDKIPVDEVPSYIDLSNYPQVKTGDFKMIYQAYLPNGEQIEITVPFTIFKK